MCHILLTHDVSVSKHLRGKKKGSWICPPTWKLDFTHSSIKINHTLPPQSPQATLRVAELASTTKMSQKNLT